MDNTNKSQKIKWSTVQKTGLGFLAVIFVGAVLLWLPVSNTKPIAFFDALFTSVSSVCVTGLVTIVPATQFTLFGKVILLALIQIGGLGVVGLSSLFVLLLGLQISVKERLTLLESYGVSDLGGILSFVKKVLIGTFVVEGAGAVLFCFQFVPQYGWIKGVWFSVFHAISAFCNAGIDIVGDSSFIGYANVPIVNITTMLLIVVSGLGFTVWFDILRATARVARSRRERKQTRGWIKELRLHTKIVLVTTAILILLGAGGFLLFEFHNQATIAEMGIGNKVMASFFQSITNRTAGFATVSQAGLHDETKLLNCVLMFIGGSPGGTAGGIKTVTMAVLFMTMYSVLIGGSEIEAFGRRISREFIRTALSIVTIAFLILSVGTIIILMLESDSVPAIDVMYEAFSAIGTVGLSCNLTSSLARGSQFVLMVLMYIGRLGSMTIALIFIGKVHPRDKIRTLPRENIMIG